VDVLLIRGMGREARHWGDFPERLRARMPQTRPVALDPPGVGTEHHRRAPLRMSQVVDDMRSRWHPTRTDQPRVVFGISFGGMVALKWAERHPSDFDFVVVANTSAANVGRPFQRITPIALRGVARGMRERDPLTREENILEIICNAPDRRAAIAPKWAALAQDAKVGRSTVVRQILAGAPFRAPKQLRQPVLVLSSPNDRFVDPRCSVRLAHRLGATLREHPTAGHAISVDAPSWTVERIVEWLRHESGSAG
jgi:pimeloyl-ACP methyl ester carboxylesterase